MRPWTEDDRLFQDFIEDIYMLDPTDKADNRKPTRDRRSTGTGSLDRAAPRFDSLEAQRAYNNYVENCRRLGADAVPWDGFQARMADWSKAVAAALMINR